MNRVFGVVAGGLTAVALAVSSAPAAESVASADGASNLVNKDVGPQRWAIAQNLKDGTVTGNVFVDDGSEPSFVWCEDVTTEGSSPGEKTFSCWGADRCPQSPCSVDEWTYLTDVPLADSFFLPDGDVTWEGLGAPVTLPLSFFEPPTDGGDGDRGSGLQITRDGRRVLVSKDLAGERWAITQNLDDGTVTGNVFFPNGDAPAFVFCDETSRTDTDLTLDCSFAEDAPAFGPIEDAEGNYFVNQLIGDDGNDGSKSFPFQTIEGALDAVPPTGGSIYVAGGVYTPFNDDPDEESDQLRIEDKSRVELYGSFDPSTWIRDEDLFPTRIETGRRGVFIRRSGGITIDGFTIETADATEPSDPSVAIIVASSRIITIRRNTILVGNGADGYHGSDAQPGLAGRGGSDGADARTCIDPRSRNGGAGGAPNTSNEVALKAGRGGAGGKGRRGDGDDGAAGAQSSGAAGRGGSVSGGDGAKGTDGTRGDSAAGAESLDLEVGSTDVFSNWGVGARDGGVGGGGGGGAGGEGFALACGGGGGGGGGGGTGGKAGRPAGSGGSSVGIAVGPESDVEITENAFVLGAGGNGGIASLGAIGGQGGPGGDGGDESLAAKAGGDGGRGGAGGRGGDGPSGAGGNSIGILVGDDETTIAIAENNVFELGTPGVGGRNQEAAPRTQGEDGRALEHLDLAEGTGDEPIPF